MFGEHNMKRIILCIILTVLILYSNATTYYFSADGISTNSGTSQSSAWNFANFNVKLFSAGDNLLLRRGDTITIALKTQSSGNSTTPITISTYGTGANPVILGFSEVNSWTAVSGSPGVYKSNVFTPQTDIKMVVLDGVPAMKGRYPNYNASNGGWLMYDAYNSSTHTITDNQMDTTQIDNSWRGEIKIRTNAYTIEGGNINAVDITAKTISFSTSTFSTSAKSSGYGYFITNSLKTLDQYGEWYYNPSDNRVYMYFGTKNPDFHDVKASTLNTLLTINNSYYVVNNIDIIGANMYGILANQPSTNLLIKNCNVIYSGNWGIIMNQKTSFTLDSSKVIYCNSSGINLGYKDDNAVISNSTVSDCGYMASNLFMDLTYQHRVGFGIYAYTAELPTAIKLINVKMINCGYDGCFVGGKNVVVTRCYVNNTCSLMDDGGGIYTGNYQNQEYITNFVISRNIVLNTFNAKAGKPPSDGTGGSGIYLDDDISHARVDSNYVSNSGLYNIFLHNNDSSWIRYNTLVGGVKAQIGAIDDGGAVIMTKDTIMHNTLFSTTPSQISYYFANGNTSGTSNPGGIAAYGYVNNNIICNPFGKVTNSPYTEIDTVGEYQVYGVSSAHWTLSQWKSNTGWDGSSTTTPIPVTNKDNYLLIYAPEADVNVPIFGTWKRMDGTNISGTVSIKQGMGTVLVR
jgi:hypothetical protein